jgi:folate-binding protein YgfZ
VKRLLAFKLRSKVTIEDQSGSFRVAVSSSSNQRASFFSDPRHAGLGFRAFIPAEAPLLFSQEHFDIYDKNRLKLGVADGSRDLIVEQSTPAEGNLDFLGGIDWKKGCYLGQELTARMHYRGLAKRRLFPVMLKGPCFTFGQHIGEFGEMRSRRGNIGLALLRIDSVIAKVKEALPLVFDQAQIWPTIPPWMKIDAPPLNR